MVVCHKRWETKTESEPAGATAERGMNGSAGALFAEGGPVFLVRRTLSAHARALLAEAHGTPAPEARPPLRLVG